MKDDYVDGIINKALREDGALPDGLEEKLANYIDSFSYVEQELVKWVFPKKRLLWMSCGVAASVALLAAVILKPAAVDTRADTFTDPGEAAVAAHEALSYMAVQMDKGLQQMAAVNYEIEKANSILIKILNY